MNKAKYRVIKIVNYFIAIFIPFNTMPWIPYASTNHSTSLRGLSSGMQHHVKMVNITDMLEHVTFFCRVKHDSTCQNDGYFHLPNRLQYAEHSVGSN
jgi:hypothetical protein